MIKIIFIFSPIIIAIIIFIVWVYTLDPKCEKGGRCTGDLYDFEMGSYKDSGMTFHYTYGHRLYCKKCGKIYTRK